MTERAPKLHDIKIAGELYPALTSGRKRAEFRLNDRDYRVGDTLLVRPVVGGVVARHEFTKLVITHAVYGPNYGIPDDYCMLSVAAYHEALAAISD